MHRDPKYSPNFAADKARSQDPFDWNEGVGQSECGMPFTVTITTTTAASEW